jgi:broad specificity phosphatase PhoE
MPVIWHSRIKPDLMAGKNVLVLAHGNSLRGIVKIVDALSEQEISRVWIPNGVPLVFKFHKDMTPSVLKDAVAPLSGQFLEKEEKLRALLAKEEELAQRVPGYEKW